MNYVLSLAPITCEKIAHLLCLVLPPQALASRPLSLIHATSQHNFKIWKKKIVHANFCYLPHKVPKIKLHFLLAIVSIPPNKTLQKDHVCAMCIHMCVVYVCHSACIEVRRKPCM